jgi:8-oxo-dGTP diphosphatase
VSPDYVPTSQAARAVGFSRNTLLRWAREGKVTPAVRSPGGHVRWDIADLERQLRRLNTEAPHVTSSASTPVQQPIVAAVIALPGRGMLATWRRDGTPPVGFLTGEIEPGESPEDAMTRETKEESGLQVNAGQVVAERIHPRTGRTMFYVEGTVVGNAEPIVGDDVELSAVKWVSLDEAVAAMEPFGGMYPPVRQYLESVLD